MPVNAARSRAWRDRVVKDRRATASAGRAAESPAMLPVRPKPLSDLPRATLAQVVGVMTDIDDTLTAHGQLDPAARIALDQLHAAALPVIAITGRPCGWSEPFARTWPVAAIVPENGAVALIRDGERVHTEYAQDEPTRRRNAARLQQVAARVLREVSGATLARDNAGRVTDIAIDHSEFAHLGSAAVERVVQIMQSEGMTATVSSIHINGWFGDHDKLSGARWMVRRLFGQSGRDLDAERERWIYVGDSTNDQAMFGYFPLSVGVANLLDFASQLHTWPAYITEGARGAGFAEVAQRLIAARA